MKITPIKTGKITSRDHDLFAILDRFLPKLQEKSILVITSKIISICEGSVVDDTTTTREDLAKKEADLYLSPKENAYGFSITIKNSIFIASGGVDESNGNGEFILWPKDPQKAANDIRSYLAKRDGLEYVGVIVTDSRTTQLRWGVTGIGLSHSGFAALNSYIQKPDIFGRKMHATKANIMDGLAAAAVVTMGEGREQTPLAVVEDVSFVAFQKRNPTKKELAMLQIPLGEDIYAQILKRVPWQKGGSGKYRR